MSEREPHDLGRARRLGLICAVIAAGAGMVTCVAPASVDADDPPPQLPPSDDPAASIAVSVEDPVPICPPGVVGHPDQVLTERCYAPAFGFANLEPATFPAAITWETLGSNPSNSSPFRVSWPLSPYPRCVVGEDEVYPCRSGEVDELGRTNNVVAWVFDRGNHSSSGIRLMAYENCDEDLWCDIVLLPQVSRFGQPATAETFAGDDLIVEVRAGIRTSPLAGQSVQIISQQRYEITGGGPPPPPTAPTASFTAEASSPRSLAWNFDASASEAFDGATLTEYRWHFGDDTAETTTVVPTTSRTYDEPGTYTVALTVEDSNGLTGTTTRTIEVEDAGLVVNSVADLPNGAEAGERCDTGNTVGDAPECTLRAAIEAANLAGKAQPISFDIAVSGTPQIVLQSALPSVTAPVSIDGETQPGGWVELAEPPPSGTMDAMRLTGQGSSVSGLVYRGFDIALTLTGTNASATGNRFGTDPAGTTITTAPLSPLLIGQGSGLVVSDNVIATDGYGIQAISGGTGTITANRIGVNAAGTAALALRPSVGILLRDVGTYTVSDNTINHGTFGIILRGASTTGTTIAGNRVGVDAAATARLGSRGIGIAVDAVPGATVSDNDVAVEFDGFSGIGIAITGVSQCEQPCQRFFGPGQELEGSVTGGSATVRGNRVGVAGPPGSIPSATGIAVYGRAPDVAVEENHVAGHGERQILFAGAVQSRAVSNVVGTNAAGTAAYGGGSGVEVAGSAATLVSGNLLSGLDSYGVLVTNYVPSPTGEVANSTETTLVSNRIGTNLSGTAAIANRAGIYIGQASDQTLVTDNVVSGSQANGIEVAVEARDTGLARNRVGLQASGAGPIPNDNGIVVSGAAFNTAIVDNIVGGNLGTGIISSTTDHTNMIRNRVGVTESGAPAPNGSGILFSRDGAALNNIVAHNTGNGIEVAPSARVVLSENSTFSNGGSGISAPGAGSAATLDVARVPLAGGDTRTWFVVDGAAVDQTIELFASPDCSDPDEGRNLVRVEHRVVGTGTGYVLLPQDPLPETAGYTITLTKFVNASSPSGAALGTTTEYSNCATPTTYPDTSGTGIPDVVQVALGGSPAHPSTVSFPGDGGHRVQLLASNGQFRSVRPVAPPAGGAGIEFPAGTFTFEITGLEVGGSVLVIASVGDATDGYFRYGRPRRGVPERWYRWDYDEGTQTGARPLVPNESGRASTWELNFVDGQPGDDDLSANGTIVDPGGPGNGSVPTTAPTTTTTTTTPTTTPTTTTTTTTPTTTTSTATTATPAITTPATSTPTSSATGTPTTAPVPSQAASTSLDPAAILPSTGAGTASSAAVALALLVAGLVLLATSRRRPLRR